ncbi:endonuclease I family protein [Elusimicrobiota bacterium]
MGKTITGPLIRSAFLSLACVFTLSFSSLLSAQQLSKHKPADHLFKVFDDSSYKNTNVFGISSSFSPRMDRPAARVAEGSAASQERGEELLKILHFRAKQGHRELSYKEARFEMFSRLDSTKSNGARGVKAAYSEVFVQGTSGHGSSYPEQGDLNGDGFIDEGGMNTEHIWPQSFFKKRGPMRSDLNQLLPTFIHTNSARDRFPFGEVADADANYKTLSGAKQGRGLFEPPDSAKGRVARAMFYFYTRYQGYNIIPSHFVEVFWNSKIDLLLRWNRDFPPGNFELRRNDLVEAVQGNRNPYIDDPSLADKVGAKAFRMQPSRKLYTSSLFKPLALKQP